MRIAIHQPRVSYYTGGGETVPLMQASYLSRNNDVTIVTSSRPESDMFLEFARQHPGVEIQRFEVPSAIYDTAPGVSQWRWDDESIAFGLATRGFYADNSFDIVATHYTIDSLLLPRNARNVLQLHGVPSTHRTLDAAALTVPSGLLSVAESVSRGWRSMYGLRGIETCYNGVDAQRFSPGNVEKDHDLLYVGRLIPIKGVDDLLAATRLLARRRPDIRVAIAGTGPEGPRLKSLVADLGLDGNVEFLGRVPDDGLVDLYRSARVCVFPSYAKEGVLTTMLESSACATPVVTTDCCGMPEFIADGVTGSLCRPRDPISLAERVGALLDDPARAQMMGVAARDSIIDRWTWDARGAQLEAAYARMVRR